MASLNVEIPDGLKKDLAKACVDRDVSIKDAVAKAITYWMELNQATSDVDVPGKSTFSSDVRNIPVLDNPKHGDTMGESRLEITPGELPWIVRFLRILRSGTIAERGIKWNIVMVLKGMGLPYDITESIDVPNVGLDTDQDAAARAEIAAVERLIGESREAGGAHLPARKRSRRA